MSASHRRHDLSDQVWDRLEPLLPGGAGKVGKAAFDNRLFLNAVFWILRTGAPGVICLRTTETGRIHIVVSVVGETGGVWGKLLDEVINEPDFEWLMIDSSHVKVHPHAAGAVGGNQEMGRTKGG